MSQIKLFVKNVFEFNQRDFWIILVGNLLVGVLFRFIKADEFVQAGAILFLLVKSISFYRATSVMPSISSEFDRFSWKYLQGLPLNKKELIFALVICNVIAVAPLFVWILSFAPQIGNFILFEGEGVTFQTKMKFLALALPILLYLGFHSIQTVVKLPRQQYSKIHSKIAFYQMVKRVSVVSFVLLYGMFALIAVTEVTGLPIGKYIEMTIKFSFGILTSWWIVPISILIVCRSYFNTLKVLQDESIGYIRQTWSSKRDFSIIAVCLILNVGLFQNLDFGIPANYQGTTLTKSVYKKDLNQVEQALKKGADINKANRFGFTPIMVAAREGNYQMFKYLLAKNASLNGNIKLEKKSDLNGANILSLAVRGGEIKIIEELIGLGLDVNHVTSETGNSPLHLASVNCNSKVVDFLVEKKAYLNAVNKRNETALHWAAAYGCFSNVVSLIEAGINPIIKSKDGKIAKDYAVSKYPKDLNYYLQKKSREPASN